MILIHKYICKSVYSQCSSEYKVPKTRRQYNVLL